MFENFSSDIIQTMKCFALESFNLSCQAEHTKINGGLNFNPGLVLIAFWTTRSLSVQWWPILFCPSKKICEFVYRWEFLLNAWPKLYLSPQNIPCHPESLTLVLCACVSRWILEQSAVNLSVYTFWDSIRIFYKILKNFLVGLS